MGLTIRSFGAATDRGLVRHGNEDVFVAEGELGLFAVVDGMGGHQSGELASQAIAAGLVTFIRQTVAEPDKTWPFPLSAGLSIDANRLQVAIRYANRQLLTIVSTEAEGAPPAATLSAALFVDDRVILSNVGDCRAYLVRDTGTVQVTQDHSFVGEQVQLGLLAPDEARVHPLRHIVTRALSGNADVSVDVWEVSLQPGDRVLLCSDGVHGLVTDDELARLAGGDARDLNDACHRIIAAANSHGGTDNSTVVLIGV